MYDERKTTWTKLSYNLSSLNDELITNNVSYAQFVLFYSGLKLQNLQSVITCNTGMVHRVNHALNAFRGLV